jgi:hypothetical protein
VLTPAATVGDLALLQRLAGGARDGRREDALLLDHAADTIRARGAPKLRNPLPDQPSAAGTRDRTPIHGDGGEVVERMTREGRPVGVVQHPAHLLRQGPPSTGMPCRAATASAASDASRWSGWPVTPPSGIDHEDAVRLRRSDLGLDLGLDDAHVEVGQGAVRVCEQGRARTPQHTRGIRQLGCPLGCEVARPGPEASPRVRHSTLTSAPRRTERSMSAPSANDSSSG